MKIFLASLVISLLALLAANKIGELPDQLVRQAAGIPPRDAPPPKVNTPVSQQPITDGSDVPVNPWLAPDAFGNPVHSVPEKQAKVEAARFFGKAKPIAYWIAGLAPLLALLLVAYRAIMRERLRRWMEEMEREAAQHTPNPAKEVADEPAPTP